MKKTISPMDNATIHACKNVDKFRETDKSFKAKHEEFIKAVK